ncbi:MAG: LamG domain-containing protein, partial [Candidatus Heimdallarchaeota archaeon]|nr:LamG domain-containing protein [Candidatus Heimdallarchaeota archaeon]
MTTDVIRCSFFANDLDTTITVTDTGWHHIACTYNWVTNERKIYLDGVLNASDVVASDPDLDIPTSTSIGIQGDLTSNPFDGTIDEVVVWNMVLEPAQVLTLFNNRTDMIHADQTRFGQTWSAEVTVNNNYEDTDPSVSNNIAVSGNLTIITPSIDAVVLNSTLL